METPHCCCEDQRNGDLREAALPVALSQLFLLKTFDNSNNELLIVTTAVRCHHDVHHDIPPTVPLVQLEEVGAQLQLLVQGNVFREPSKEHNHRIIK